MFAGLKSFLLGLSRGRGELAQELARLKEASPSVWGPDAAAGLLGDLARAEARAEKLTGALDDEAHKERERVEREKQEAEWKKKQDEAAEGQRHCQEELEQLRQERDDLEKELVVLAEQRKQAALQKKQRDKDLRVKEKRLRGDIEGKSKRLGQLEEEIDQHQQTIESQFEFRPPHKAGSGKAARPGARFVPTSTAAAQPVVPGEALPQVGVLLVHQKERFLAIDRWEDLVLGEQEAQRLKATLVAAPEKT